MKETRTGSHFVTVRRPCSFPDCATSSCVLLCPVKEELTALKQCRAPVAYGKEEKGEEEVKKIRMRTEEV